MDIEVSIERLVLDGLDLEPGGAEALAAALQSELARLAAAASHAAGVDGLSSENVARLVLDPVAVPAAAVPAAERPGMLGRQLGAAIHGGLRHG